MVLSDLYDKIYELRDLIKKSSEYTLTKEKEEEMMNDEKFIILSNAYANAEEDYNKLIKLGIEDKDKKETLIKAKEDLYSYAKVKNYLESYHSINEMLDEISKTIDEVLK